MEYLTPEDYEIAETNGIPRINAYKRFYYEGMTKERTITQPIAKRTQDSPWKQWKEVCEANGVCRSTFNSRVKKGIPHEEAATQRPLTPKEIRSQGLNGKKRRLTDEQRAIADANGIPYFTVMGRLNTRRQVVGKWTIEEAITVPVLSIDQIKSSGYRHSPFNFEGMQLFWARKKFN